MSPTSGRKMTITRDARGGDPSVNGNEYPAPNFPTSDSLTPKLFYFVVNAKGYPDEYSEIIKAESHSKAKKAFYWKHIDGLDLCGIQYIDLRAQKLKGVLY